MANKYCIHCGKPNLYTAAKCQGCGKNLSLLASTPPPAPKVTPTQIVQGAVDDKLLMEKLLLQRRLDELEAREAARTPRYREEEDERRPVRKLLKRPSKFESYEDEEDEVSDEYIDFDEDTELEFNVSDVGTNSGVTLGEAIDRPVRKGERVQLKPLTKAAAKKKLKEIQTKAGWKNPAKRGE